MSFGQEMKDFMAAWQTVTDSGTKKKANDIDAAKAKVDEAYKDALLKLRQDELVLKKSAAAGAAGSRASSNARADAAAKRATERQKWAKEKHDAWMADRQAAIAAGQQPPAVDEPVVDAEDDSTASSDIPEWGDDPVATQATGGMVKRYEAGGVVTPDQTAADEAPVRPKLRVSVGAIPTSPTAPAAPASKPIMVGAEGSGGAGVKADAGPPEPAVDAHASEVVLKGAKDALGSIGKDYITKLGQKTSATGGAGGVEPLPQADLNTIMKTALDGGKVPAHLEGMVALSAAWNSNIKPEARAKLAMGIMKTQQLQAQTLGQFAGERLKAGDYPAFCKLINDACGRFPTDHRFEVEQDPKYGFVYHVYDAKGDVSEKGRIPAEKAWELAQGVSDGSMFIKAVDAYARGASEKAAAPDKYNAALEGVTTAYTAASKAIEDLKLAQSSDDGDVEAAQRKAVAARKALDIAENKARATAKASGVKTLNSDLRSARKVDEVLAAPTAIPEEQGPPAPPPAPDDRSLAEKYMPTALGGREAPTKTMSAEQLAKAKAALAGGADYKALREKLTAAGYSTEGL